MIQHFTRKISYEFGVIGPEHEADAIEGICEGFVRCNQVQIRADPDEYPCCLGCGKYRYVEPTNCVQFDWKTGRKFDDRNCQHVLGAHSLDRRREGTCIDLACMLCAIYREKEGDRRARVIIKHQLDSSGVRMDGKYHAMIMRGDGEIIDASAKAQAAQSEEWACGCDEE